MPTFSEIFSKFSEQLKEGCGAWLEKRRAPVIPIVRLAGILVAGEGKTAAPGRLSLAGCEKALQKAFSIKKAPCVVLIINSPGGSPVQSHLIFRFIRHLAKLEDKQVLVFVEDVAASGGYLLALAGDEIFADASSILGSIGVISASFGFEKAIEKLGISRRLYTAGDKKGLLDPFSRENKRDVAHLKSVQAEVHEAFIALVRQRRGAKLDEQKEDLFSGAFWAGKTALAFGLIDALNDLHSVIHARFGKNARLKSLSLQKQSLLSRLRMLHGSKDTPRALIDEGLTALEERLMWENSRP